MTELFHLFASRPIVNRTVEPVREFEPLVWEDPLWVKRIKLAANVAAGVAILALIWVWMGAPGI